MEIEISAFAEAVAQAQQMAKGTALAQQATTEAVIAALLGAFPSMASDLQQCLDTTAEEYRFQVSREGALAEATFEDRIAHMTSLVAALSKR